MADEIEFNPKQACVIKNIGPERENALLVPKEIHEKVMELVRRQAFELEFKAHQYLLEHPDVSMGALIVELHKAPLGEPDIQVLRVRNGEEIARVTGPRIKVVGDE